MPKKIKVDIESIPLELTGTVKKIVISALGANGRHVELNLIPGGMHVRAPEDSPPRIMVSIEAQGGGGTPDWHEHSHDAELDVYVEERELFAELSAAAAREASKPGALNVPRVVED